MKSTIYVIKYWVPFPSSEYGGVCVVIAKDDEECFTLLKTYEDEDSICAYDYEDEMKAAIRKADKFNLANDEDSRIV